MENTRRRRIRTDEAGHMKFSEGTKISITRPGRIGPSVLRNVLLGFMHTYNFLVDLRARKPIILILHLRPEHGQQLGLRRDF